MNSDTLICKWIFAFPIGIIQFSTPRKWSFLLYFSSLHDYWPPTTLISWGHNSGEMEWCEKRAFQLLKMRKMKFIWNIKTKCVTDLLLTVRSSSMKDYTCHYVESTLETNVYINFNKINVNFEIFLFTRNRVFKHKGVVTNLQVCCNSLGKMRASYILHFFTKNSNLHTYEKFNIFLHNICRDVQHSLFRSR